jgi:dihydropyrimidine dehydrogenase (NAD+) subunit PreA
MASLYTQFLGIDFPNPFILASSPSTANGMMVKHAFERGWGGAVLKTVGLEPTLNPSPRVQIIKAGRDKRGMVNIELISDRTVEEWGNEIDLIRDAYPERPLIASIMGGGRPEDWESVVNHLEPHGINAFEMNVSCPNFAERKGAQLGQDSEALQLAISWVREATSLPIIVKLTPNVTDILSLARVAKEAGADAVTTTNTLSGLAGIDLDTFRPQPTVDQIGIFGGYSGPGLKPVSLRCTANVAQNMDIGIFGCGGIAHWQDAAEYMTVGASAIQICTAVMWNGYEIIDKLTQGLSKFLDRKGFSSPAELVGRALPQIKTFPDLDLEIKLVASIDAEQCNGCGICVKACQSGGFDAIEMIDDVAVVNFYKCDGCGLCGGVCPLGFATMERIDSVSE